VHADTLAPCRDELSLGAAFCNDSKRFPFSPIGAARTVRFRCEFVRQQDTVQCGACNMGRAVRHQPRKFADQSPLGLVLVSHTDSVGIVDVDPHDFEV